MAPTASVPFASKADSSALLPAMGVVFVGFLVIGVALPVVPLHTHQGLGLGTIVVVLVTGGQFAASVLTGVCVWFGNYSDQRGAKRAIVVGIPASAVAGFINFSSVTVQDFLQVLVAIRLLSRALLGGVEIFIITGAVSWALVLSDAARTGQVVTWMGMAIFAAVALGAPIGTYLHCAGGFAARRRQAANWLWVPTPTSSTSPSGPERPFLEQLHS